MKYFISVLFLMLAVLNYSCKSEVNKEKKDSSQNELKKTSNEVSNTTKSVQNSSMLKKEFIDLIEKRNQLRIDRSKTTKGTKEYKSVQSKIIAINKEINSKRGVLDEKINDLINKRDKLKVERKSLKKGTKEYKLVHSKIQGLNQQISGLRSK